MMSLLTRVIIRMGWWAIGSTAWKSCILVYVRPSSPDNPSQSVISSIEARIASYVDTSGVYEGETGETRPAW